MADIDIERSPQRSGTVPNVRVVGPLGTVPAPLPSLGRQVACSGSIQKERYGDPGGWIVSTVSPCFCLEYCLARCAMAAVGK